MKISIIMPVYNAAGTLMRALDSIAAQTFDGEMELCAVVDAGSDSSPEILKRFKAEFERNPKHTAQIVELKENGGVANARNIGLESSTGDYICYVDADDILAPTTLEKAARLAQDNEIIGWDWTLSSDSGSRYMRQPSCSSTTEALQAMMGGTLRWNLWLYLVKRDLYEGVRFTKGLNMGEDMMAMIRIVNKAKSFAQIHESLYTYIQTKASISRTMTDENLRQVCANLDIACKDLDKETFALPIALLKLNVKHPLLVSSSKNDYIRWLECYPEASFAIWKNSYLPFRTKLLQWLASKRLFLLVRIYNILVFNILYKILC